MSKIQRGAHGELIGDQTLKRMDYWKTVVARDESAWAAEVARMDWREELFAGTHEIKPTCDAEAEQNEKMYCYHVRNVVAENIESMVDSRVPRPKVMALRKEDEGLARKLEELLRFYTQRHHMRVVNDLAERMGPIQGGLCYLVEWDATRRIGTDMGDATVTLIHPKQLIPQAGIYTDIEDMDHVAVKLSCTKKQVLLQYGVDVRDVGETDPNAKGTDDAASEEELVTVYMLYYKNDRGGIGQMGWCGDYALVDWDDYQSRRLRRCASCGALDSYTEAPRKETEEEMLISGERSREVHRCPWCEGTEFEDVEVDEEEILLPEVLLDTNANELEFEGAKAYFDEGETFKLEARSTRPYYKPNKFPIILQKNISKFGQLLGESDVDKMADQQNTIKRLDKKLLDRTITAGTIITLPNDTHIQTDLNDQRVVRLKNPAEMSQIQTFEFTGNLSQIVELEAKAYEEARQITGITDSMQGRRDPTATSAKAKEYSASKSEGRLESRRVMKQEAWCRIFELISKLFIAYADEPRQVRVEQSTGEVEYETFRRTDFLKQAADGTYYYEDGFVWTVDDATSIGESREAMWQEINASFGAGTLGNPQELPTLILYWGLMEEQGYPGAGQVKAKLEARLQEQQQAEAAQAQMQGQMQGMGGQGPQEGMMPPQGGQAPAGVM